ncbi:ATP-binding protein, partial [Salmonella sp. SAL4458]|uniref:ATP-binding protein n=1 Tax=Salmonella sp. SAL4458 TaxID=3159913 RepID=UPI00397C6055
VQAGETRLRQILGNLLTNALDALAEKAPPRRLWVIASQDQHGVTLTLRDNGPGFSEDALAHADSANDLRLMIKLGSESDADHLSSLTQGLSLEITDDDPAGRRFR